MLRTEFIQANAERIPFEDGSMDAVRANFLLLYYSLVVISKVQFPAAPRLVKTRSHSIQLEIHLRKGAAYALLPGADLGEADS